MSYSNNHTAQLIEVGGVEPLLQEQAGVRQAVVLAREDAVGKCLVAYIVVDRQNPPAVSQLRRRLAARLPDYTAPPTFVLLNELPLTPNGKVDRRALPAPDQTRPAPEDAFVAPRTPVEEGLGLARIWSQVLGLEQVGIHDNFFELGGHSRWPRGSCPGCAMLFTRTYHCAHTSKPRLWLASL